jgi:hypothetical protein
VSRSGYGFIHDTFRFFSNGYKCKLVSEVVELFKLLDLKVHGVVTVPFDKNGKHGISESHVD